MPGGEPAPGDDGAFPRAFGFPAVMSPSGGLSADVLGFRGDSSDDESKRKLEVVCFFPMDETSRRWEQMALKRLVLLENISKVRWFSDADIF